MPVMEAAHLDLYIVASLPSTFINPKISIKIQAEIIDLSEITLMETVLLFIFIPLALIIYFLTILHLRKKIDLFRLCRKKPPTEFELQ